MARIGLRALLGVFCWIVSSSVVGSDSGVLIRMVSPPIEAAVWEDEVDELPGLPSLPPVVADEERPQRVTDEERPSPRRDPTEPGEELRDLVAPLRLGQPGRAGGAAGLTIPRPVLKGRIVGPSAPPAILVELEGSLYVLHEASELTVEDPAGGLSSVTLQVQRIDASEVRIEILPFRKVMILR